MVYCNGRKNTRLENQIEIVSHRAWIPFMVLPDLGLQLIIMLIVDQFANFFSIIYCFCTNCQKIVKYFHYNFMIYTELCNGVKQKNAENPHIL